jgi:hypothetical protein
VRPLRPEDGPVAWGWGGPRTYGAKGWATGRSGRGTDGAIFIGGWGAAIDEAGLRGIWYWDEPVWC